MKIISSIQAFTAHIKSNFSTFVGAVIQQFFYFISSLALLKNKLHNLRDTNLELGLIHLENGALFDSRIRFYILDKWLAPNDPEIKYYQAWISILEHNYQEAEKHFIDARQHLNAEEMVQFVQAVRRKNVDTIPITSLELYRRFTIQKDLQDDCLFLLAGKLVDAALEEVSEKPDAFSILDVGASIGIIGEYARRRIGSDIIIDGLELSLARCNILLTLSNNNHNVYRDIFHGIATDDFVLPHKYNLIISMLGLDYKAEIIQQLKKLKSKLTKKGVLAFAVRVSEKCKFDKETFCFSYTQEYLEKELELAKLKIASITIETIADMKVAIVICRNYSN